MSLTSNEVHEIINLSKEFLDIFLLEETEERAKSFINFHSTLLDMDSMMANVYLKCSRQVEQNYKKIHSDIYNGHSILELVAEVQEKKGVEEGKKSLRRQLENQHSVLFLGRPGVSKDYRSVFVTIRMDNMLSLLVHDREDSKYKRFDRLRIFEDVDGSTFTLHSELVELADIITNIYYPKLSKKVPELFI